MYRVMKFIYTNIFFSPKLYICLLIIKLFNLECVLNKPILKPVQNVTTSLGETANLTCKAEMGACYNLTFPNYIWARNGTRISELNTTNRYSTYVEL